MSASPSSPFTIQIRAPKESGTWVSVPSLESAIGLATTNRDWLDHFPNELAGLSLPEFRAWTRDECLAASSRWMRNVLGIEPPRIAGGNRPLFVTGHQPQLVHPGVWMKNVAVSALGSRSGGDGLNLIVDNDVVQRQSILVPAGSQDDPSLVEVAYDDPQPQQPWEEVKVLNRNLFDSFHTRINETLQPWGIDPILRTAWPAAITTAASQPHTAVCLSACRHQQERLWGISNFELPISELSRTKPFLAFVGFLCQHHERLFDVYNEAIRDYRQRHRIRNHHHPVPELLFRDGWYELPFWIWQPGEQNRRRLMARRRVGRIELGTKGERLLDLPENPADTSALESLQHSWRLRPRALTNTLFARICLGDLFIHGIGGAKYDEIADFILARLGFPVPRYLTLTATLHLPLGGHAATPGDVARLRNQLRRTKFNGDPTGADPEVARLQARKDELLEQARTQRALGLSKRERAARRGDNRTRHLQLKQIQSELSERSVRRVAALQEELNLVTRAVQANQVLHSREFPAVLFPEQLLRDLVDRIRHAVR